jgi:hypothetical protein
MKTTLTIKTAATPHKLHIRKNGVPYAVLESADAVQPWTDSEEAKVGDKYQVILETTPKQLRTNVQTMPGGPVVMGIVEEIQHGILSEPYIVNPQEMVGDHSVLISGVTG